MHSNKLLKTIYSTYIPHFQTFTTRNCKRRSNNLSVEVQNTNDFNKRVKNCKTPVIVDFFATWCNPCRILTPRLETVIAENNMDVLLAKVDIDKNTDLAMNYNVGSIPALLALRNGKVEAKLVGLQDEDNLRKFVQKVSM